MPDFEENEQAVEDSDRGNSLLRTATGEDTPVTEVNEYVTGNPVQLTVIKQVPRVPLGLKLLFLGPNSVKNDDDERPH